VANGIEIRLFNGATAQASLTGLTCLWWDAEDVYDFGAPQGRTDVATTDSDGDLILDISNISGHSVGGIGYLLVRKEDLLDHEDSLVFQGKVTVASITGGTVLKYVPDWTRNPDWQAIDDVHVSGESRFEGLHAVFKGCDNPCAFSFTVTGGYDVDWGDGGAIEAVASGVKAQHFFDYDDCDAASETGISEARAVTFTDAGDLVTLASHGFQNGTEIAFSVVTTTTGITAYTRYWVVGVSGNDFQVAATKGGSAITLTNNGTGSVYLPGYRQVIVKVTPTTANAFTSVSFQQRHGSIGSFSYCTGWLDVYLNAPSAAINFGGTTVYHRLVEKVSFPETALTTAQNFFLLCARLQYIEAFDTGSATVFTQLFSSCYSLKSVPLFSFGSVTSLTYIFSDCFSLVSVPLFDVSSATSLQDFFSQCRSLRSVPLLNTSSCLNVKNMFLNCYSLQSIPLLNTSFVTDFSSFLSGCYSLTHIPLLDTGAGTNFTNAFSQSGALENIPLIDIGSGTTLTGIFTNTSALQKAALVGTKESITYNNPGLLSAAALDEIYTNLATVVGKTITVTGNYGTASDDPTIATAKGWTVTS